MFSPGEAKRWFRRLSQPQQFFIALIATFLSYSFLYNERYILLTPQEMQIKFILNRSLEMFIEMATMKPIKLVALFAMTFILNVICVRFISATTIRISRVDEEGENIAEDETRHCQLSPFNTILLALGTSICTIGVFAASFFVIPFFCVLILYIVTVIPLFLPLLHAIAAAFIYIV